MSSCPSSSYPNCLRGKRGQSPDNLLPKLTGNIYIFKLREISRGRVNTGIDKEDKGRPCRNYCQ